jgi:hypothetical protein
MIDRREFLLASAATAAQAAPSPRVTHVLPTVSHDRALIKVSFAASRSKPPVLKFGRRTALGAMTDTRGRFWRFDVPELSPATEYALALDGTEPWTLRTFPAPGTKIEKFRLLVYTCAGGDERQRTVRGPHFLPLAARQRLFDHALNFKPDAIVGNGDHIYWDLRQTGAPPNFNEDLLKEVGSFTRDLPVLGTANEDVLKRVADAQIAQLYGTRFKGVPVFFPQDDHDYFENDDANERMVTYPPDHLMLQLGRGVRRMYFPEFLPDANRPVGLPGASAVDTPPGTGESFGTIRYGDLAEVLLYDCRRFLTLAGPNAVIVPREVESWITRRLAARDVGHVVQLPSMPPAWTSGKWGDWYPDVLDRTTDKLTTAIPKPYWQPGWMAQHDRLMQAASAAAHRTPVVVSGDLHAIAHGRMMRAGAIDLSANPVEVLLAGPIGTADNGWPSMARGARPIPGAHVTVDEKLPCVERNGFTILDFEPGRIVARLFRDTENFYTAEISRR